MISEYYNLIWSIAILVICGMLIYGILLIMYDIGYYVIYKILRPLFSLIKDKIVSIKE